MFDIIAFLAANGRPMDSRKGPVLGDFLPAFATSGYRTFADLDGAEARAWLQCCGAEGVSHRDTGRNGLAEGTIAGRRVTLSTNGFCTVALEA